MNLQGQQPIAIILRNTKEYYPLIIIYSICISVLTLATPISVQSLVNTFSFGPYIQPLFVLSMILLGLLSILGLLKSLQYLLVEHLQRKLYAKITTQISNTYLNRSNKSKQAFYARVVEKLEKDPGIPKENVLITIVENHDIDWSFADGEASFIV